MLNKTLHKVLARPHVAAVDDERPEGNTIIVILAPGYCFRATPGCSVQGFDSAKDCEFNTRADDVYYVPAPKKKPLDVVTPGTGCRVFVSELHVTPYTERWFTVADAVEAARESVRLRYSPWVIRDSQHRVIASRDEP